MRISIIHPTRHRLKQALNTRAKWLLNADGEVEYIYSFDTDDLTVPSWMDGIRNPNTSAIEAINRAAEVASGDLFVVVSDDFNEPPEHWDTMLLAEIGDRRDLVLKTRDGIQNTLVTLPILDRTYYNRFGYVYSPEYGHLFADTEMTVVSMMLGRYIKSDLVFLHNHYSIGKVDRDAVNEKNDLTWEQGEKVFGSRLIDNFGIDEPLVKYESIVW